MTLPIPGQAVRGSKSGKPIMALFDLLGRTWSLGILWQLRNAPATFRQLQSRCEDISPTLLNTRVKELHALGLIEKHSSGYKLTPHAVKLIVHIEPMAGWAESWSELISQRNNHV